MRLRRDGVVNEDAPMTSVPAIIRLSDERGDFVTGADGCVMFWPEADRGGFNAWHLRALADELDRRNADWFRQMDAALSKGTPDA